MDTFSEYPSNGSTNGPHPNREYRTSTSENLDAIATLLHNKTWWFGEETPWIQHHPDLKTCDIQVRNIRKGFVDAWHLLIYILTCELYNKISSWV